MENSIFTDKTVYNTPKTDASDKEKACYDALEKLGISFERVSHEHIGTIEGLIEVCEVLGASIHKNLFLCNAQKTDFYLLVMPGEKPFKTKFLSPQLGCSHLSFAPPEYMEELLCIAPGSLSVLGLMNDKEGRVRLLVDRDTLEGEFVGCHPCVNTSSLKIRTSDVFGPLLEAMKHTMTVVELPWKVEEE